MQAVARFNYAGISTTLYNQFCLGSSVQCTEVACSVCFDVVCESESECEWGVSVMSEWEWGMNAMSEYEWKVNVMNRTQHTTQF